MHQGGDTTIRPSVNSDRQSVGQTRRQSPHDVQRRSSMSGSGCRGMDSTRVRKARMRGDGRRVVMRFRRRSALRWIRSPSKFLQAVSGQSFGRHGGVQKTEDARFTKRPFQSRKFRRCDGDGVGHETRAVQVAEHRETARGVGRQIQDDQTHWKPGRARRKFYGRRVRSNKDPVWGQTLLEQRSPASALFVDQHSRSEGRGCR